MDADSSHAHRYSLAPLPDAVDIDVSWAAEAAGDPNWMIIDPDPRSRTGQDGLSVTRRPPDFVLTVIATRIEEELWGVTAWKTTGAERRSDQEVRDDDAN